MICSSVYRFRIPTAPFGTSRRPELSTCTRTGSRGKGQRLYREGGLAVRRRRRKRRRSAVPRPVRPSLAAPNERWALDVVHDTLSTGRQCRCLTVLDEYS